MLETIDSVIDIKLGDRVIGKKTGTLTPSTVIGIMTYSLYKNCMMQDDGSTWDRLYPNWRDGLVIVGLFDEPTCNISFQEFKDNIDLSHHFYEKLKKASLLNEYILLSYSKYPKVRAVSYPYEDVSVLG